MSLCPIELTEIPVFAQDQLQMALSPILPYAPPLQGSPRSPAPNHQQANYVHPPSHHLRSSAPICGQQKRAIETAAQLVFPVRLLPHASRSPSPAVSPDPQSPPQYRFHHLFISCIDFHLLISILMYMHLRVYLRSLSDTTKSHITDRPRHNRSLKIDHLPPSLPSTILSLRGLDAFVVPHNIHDHHPAHTPCSSPTRTTFFIEIAAIYEIYEAGKIDKNTPTQAKGPPAAFLWNLPDL